MIFQAGKCYRLKEKVGARNRSSNTPVGMDPGLYLCHKNGHALVYFMILGEIVYLDKNRAKEVFEEQPVTCP